MTLLFPAALAAFVALAIPLAVHLARRAERAPVDFAALRWLAARPRPRTRLRFDEWWLLAVRLLVVALVVLWLARPAADTVGDTRPVVAVIPGAVGATVAAGARGVWLAPGLPPLAAKSPAAGAVASLLRQLDAELAPGVALTVVAPAVLSGLDAELPRLSRAVTWRVGGGAMPVAVPARPRAAALVVRFVPGSEAAARYLVAATGAAQPHATIDSGLASKPLPPAITTIAWLVPGALPPALADRVRRGATVVDVLPAARGAVVWTADGAPLVVAEPLGRGRLLHFVRPLDAAATPALLEPDFAERLAALLSSPPAAPTLAAAADVAPLAGAGAYVPPPRDLRPWLALAVAALFLVERALATGRRQGE